MPIGPTAIEQRARALADLRMGLPVLVGDRLAAAVETLRAERAALICRAPGAALALTARRAATLHVGAYDEDLVRLGVTAGTSLEWLQAMADPSLDLASPLKGPFHPLRGGDASPHRVALALAKSAQLLPAALVAPASAFDPEELSGTTRIEPADFTGAGAMQQVVSGRVPTRLAGPGRVFVFRPEEGGVEHYAVEVGRPDRAKSPLTRLHSACFTGDVLGSLKCDCGPQLDAALAAIGTAGEGVLLYLNQEGRGIGMANKMRAYSLQDQGFDTVEANHRLGFEDDERDFRLGADILHALGFRSVRLMTNNPAKVAMLERHGVAVAERVPLVVGENPLNSRYLATKASKSGHLL